MKSSALAPCNKQSGTANRARAFAGVYGSGLLRGLLFCHIRCQWIDRQLVHLCRPLQRRGTEAHMPDGHVPICTNTHPQKHKQVKRTRVSCNSEAKHMYDWHTRRGQLSGTHGCITRISRHFLTWDVSSQSARSPHQQTQAVSWENLGQWERCCAAKRTAHPDGWLVVAEKSRGLVYCSGRP